MFLNIIIFFIILIILTLILHYSKNYKEGFFDFPDAKHNDFIKQGQTKFNELTNTINLSDPNIPITPTTAKELESAINNIDADPTANVYSLKTDVEYTVPKNLPNTFEKSKLCESKPPTCSAFDDPVFANNCGISFDTKGTNAGGKPFAGGLFVAPDDRKRQSDMFENVKSTGSAPYDPYKVLQPTFGKAKSGTFAITKDQCLIVKEKVDCESKQSFNSPNCTQCYTSQSFSRISPTTQKLPSTLYLFGSGTGYIWTSDTPDKNLISKGGIKLSPNTATTVNIPGNSEGTVFSVIIQPDEGKFTYVGGYLEGKTPRGTFKIDLMNLVKIDQVSSLKPRINGTIKVNGFRALSLIPGNGQTSLNLVCMMPFSFLNIYDTDALTCDNGPIITKEESATFLESDPCFGKANKPGNYKLECLQTRWINLGGTQQGSGYPSNQTKANALQIDANGNGLVIDDIVDNISVKIKQALTGFDENGIPLSINDWNTVSMWATGVPINTPCDGPNKNSGPLSKDCLSYLYMNKGTASHIGATYTLAPSSMASMKGQNTPNTYCQPGAPLDPNTPEGLKFAQKLGGINAVKQSYDQINRTANDNSLPNETRQSAIDQCYGVQLRPQTKQKRTGPTQVFAVSNGGTASVAGYVIPKDQAQKVCSQYGAQVATTAQLQDAQSKGADWCFTAWVSDSDQAMYPITTRTMAGCGNGSPGIKVWTPPNNKAGVNCYGPKPGIEDVPAGSMLSFNQTSWDIPEGAIAAPVVAPIPTATNTPKPSSPPAEPQGVFIVTGGQVPYGFNLFYADSNLAKPNMNWIQIPGQVTSISLAPNGFICATNSNNNIFFLQNYKNWGAGWKMGPGILRQIHTDGNLICGTNANNMAFSANFANAAAGQWTVLPSVLTKIVTYQNKYYCVGLDKHIYYLTSPTSQWVMTLTSGVFNDISIDDGVILLIGTNNALYYSDSNLFSPAGNYQQVPNQPAGFKSVSISKGSIYAIDTSGTPWYTSNYKNTNWTKVPGGGQVTASHRVTKP